MARIIDGQVKEILTTDLEDTTPFITAANLLVDVVLSDAAVTAKGLTALTEAHKTEIERWLAAHFACMQDPHEREAIADQAEAKFEGDWGLGLDHTRYGQQVKILDTTGLLAAHSTSASEGRRVGAVRVAAREE